MLEFKPIIKERSFPWLPVIIVVLVGTILIPFGLMGFDLWGASTLKYELTPTELVIPYGMRTVHIDRSDITGGQLVANPTNLGRLVGTSMPGLYAGSWSSRETGRITLYATRQDQLVVLTTAARTWGITPADPAGFLQAMATGQTGIWQPSREGGSPWGFASFLLFEIPTVVLVWFALAYYMPPLKSIAYLLTDDALVIRGGRMKVTIPYRSITAVWVDSPPGRPMRQIGTAVSGLLWGSFRWKAAGPNLKLYATQAKPLVLISAGHSTYGITPAEQDQFVAELTQRIGG